MEILQQSTSTEYLAPLVELQNVYIVYVYIVF